MYSLSSFLEHVKTVKNLDQENIISFSGREFPLLFFNQLLFFLKKNSVPIETIDCVNTEISLIKANLSALSFSGKLVYWLENFYIMPEKKQKELFLYLNTYSGPHTIILFSDKKNILPTHAKIIDLPDTVTLQDFMKVRFLVNDTLSNKSDFLSQITMYLDLLSLDTVCLLSHYELVIGKTADDFFNQWITRIIDPTHSLFIVSQYFFAKKEKQFFRQWSLLSDQYAPTFWPTFWADQCWRAYIYCDLMQQKKYAEAKKAQYKLPFSFINRDWHLYSLDELSNVHQLLYEIDHKMKNGASEIAIEYFYNQFFNNDFR